MNQESPSVFVGECQPARQKKPGYWVSFFVNKDCYAEGGEYLFLTMLQEVYICWNQPNNGPSGPQNFSNTLINLNRLLNRKSPFKIQNWILDSGAFTRLENYGSHISTKKYAAIATKFASCGNLKAVVTQDYLPRPTICQRLNLSIADCQNLTILRYDKLKQLLPPNIYTMPVLQGNLSRDYGKHLQQYGGRIDQEAWVGVGNLVGRNNNEIVEILCQVKELRPDIDLHGFGVKLSQIKNGLINCLLYSCDNAAGTYLSQASSTEKQRLAIAYQRQVLTTPIVLNLFQYQQLSTIKLY